MESLSLCSFESDGLSELASWISDSVRNSTSYCLEQAEYIEFITKSLYLFSNISWVKTLGTLILIVFDEIDIGSQLLIQVLKLT